MEEVDGFRIKRDAWGIAEGYVPLIEATGRSSSGKELRGSLEVGDYGIFPDKRDALRAVEKINVAAVKILGDRVVIKVAGLR